MFLFMNNYKANVRNNLISLKMDYNMVVYFSYGYIPRICEKQIEFNARSYERTKNIFKNNAKTERKTTVKKNSVKRLKYATI